MKVLVDISNGPINPEFICENEKDLDIIFPHHYKQLCYLHDGASFVDNILKIYDGCTKKYLTTIVCAFISHNRERPSNIIESTYTMATTQEQINILPFAQEAFGDMICFDYRGANRHSDDPPVVYWNHEFGPEEGRNPCPLAPNFLAFMQMLQPNPHEPPSDEAIEVEI